MCMKYIVVWGFPSQINFKENVAFNRNYSNSCKNRYGSHHWEGLKALLSTTRIKRECVILLFLFCSRLYLVVLVYDHFWMNCSIKKNIYIWIIEPLMTIFISPWCHDLWVGKKGQRVSQNWCYLTESSYLYHTSWRHQV